MTNPINPDIAPEILQRYFSLASHTDNNQRLPKDQVAAYLSAEKDPLKQSIVSEVPSINEAVRNLVAPDGETERLLQSLLLDEKGNPRSLDGDEVELLGYVRANVAHYLSHNATLSSAQKNALKDRLVNIQKRIDDAKKLSPASGTAGSSSAASNSASANAQAIAAQQREAEEEAKPAVTSSTLKATASNLTDERRAELSVELSYVNESIGLLEKNYGPEQGWIYLRSHDIISDEYANKKTQEYNRLVDQKAQLEKTLGIS